MPNAKAKENTRTFQVPTLKRFKVVDLELLSPDQAEEAAKKLRDETLPKLQEQVTNTLSWLEGIERQSREAQELAGKEIKERRQWLKEYLEHEFGPFRRTTWLSLLLYYFSKPFKTKEEVLKWTTGLCGKKYLQETEDGPLTIFGQSYGVNESASFGEPEIRQLKTAVANLENGVKWAERLSYRSKSKDMLDEGNLSTKEFLQGKPGFYSILSSLNGNIRPEGTLVVETDGKRISPCKAMGTFQEDIEELKEMGRFLLLYTLDWDAISPDFFTKKAQFSEREAELLIRFWRLLKNGISWKARKERVQAIREEHKKFAANNNAIADEEFLIERKTGSSFLEYERAWNWYTPEKETKETLIYNLFFVIERQETEDKNMVIRVAKFPPWLKDLFSGCDEFHPEGEKFEGLPQNLRMVLQSVWNQVERRSHIHAT